MDRMSEALEEAFASGDENGCTLYAVEIDHPTFEDGPVRVIAGADGDPAALPQDRRIMLPIVPGGLPVEHVPCGFEFVRPGADHDGPTDGKIRIDNVSRLLDGHLRGAQGFNAPVTVTVRPYVVPDEIAAVTGPDEEIRGLELRRVMLTAETAEGTLQYPDGRELNIPTGPHAVFTREEYPALYR